MSGFVIFLLGIIILWFLGIKKKNPILAVVGAIVILAALNEWFPNLFPALVVLVEDIGGDLVKFSHNAGKK